MLLKIRPLVFIEINKLRNNAERFREDSRRNVRLVAELSREFGRFSKKLSFYSAKKLLLSRNEIRHVFPEVWVYVEMHEDFETLRKHGWRSGCSTIKRFYYLRVRRNGPERHKNLGEYVAGVDESICPAAAKFKKTERITSLRFTEINNKDRINIL